MCSLNPFSFPFIFVRMTTASIPAFIGGSSVTVLLDPSFGTSRVSPVLVHKLDIPCSLGISGVPLAIANVHICTNDGGYHSHLPSSVSYDLTSDIVLGNDSHPNWRFVSKALWKTSHLLIRGFRHNVCYSDPTLTLLLTTYPASIRLARSLRNDVKAREALASLLTGCCSNVLFCCDAVAGHSVPVLDRWLFMRCCTTCSVVCVPPSLTFRFVT